MIIVQVSIRGKPYLPPAGGDKSNPGAVPFRSIIPIVSSPYSIVNPVLGFCAVKLISNINNELIRGFDIIN